MLLLASGSMLECAMTPDVVVQGASCTGRLAALGPGRHDVSLAQAAGVHGTENCEVLGKCCGWFAMMAWAVGLLGGTSKSRSMGPRQATVVARADDMHTLSCGGQLHEPV